MTEGSSQDILAKAAFHARQCNAGVLCKSVKLQMYGQTPASVTSYLNPHQTRVVFTEATHIIQILNHYPPETVLRETRDSLRSHPTIAYRFYTNPPVPLVRIKVLEGWEVVAYNPQGVTLLDVQDSFARSLKEFVLLADFASMRYKGICGLPGYYDEIPTEILPLIRTRQDMLSNMDIEFDRVGLGVGGTWVVRWATILTLMGKLFCR